MGEHDPRGEVKVPYPDAKFELDYAPADIGRAAGTTTCAGGMQATEGAEPRTSMTVYGPNLLSQRKPSGSLAWEILGGKDIKVTEQSNEEAVESMVKAGMLAAVGRANGGTLGGVGRRRELDLGLISKTHARKEAIANFQKMPGALTTLEDWAKANYPRLISG